MRRPVIIAIASVALVAGISAALSVPQASLAAANAATSSPVTDAQKTQYVFDGTNEVRAEAGTTPLVRNAALDKVASDWAYQQWKNGAMSHNPNYSTQIPAGWSHAGENVASGYTYDTVVQAWVNSAEHYRNLIGDYTDLGVGYYQGPDGTRYWVQEFAKYATTTVPPKQTPTTAPSTPSSAPSKPASPSSSPSTPAAPTTPASAPNTGGYPAEPSAPAGTNIPLASPSFEGSLSGWTATGASLDGPNTSARGGKYALAVSGGQTVSQTVAATVTAGETDTVTIWVKPGTTTGITGSLKLTAVGGTTETATTSFSDSSGWMKVSVGLPVSRAGHTGLRIDVVLSNSGRAYRLDSTSLVRTKNAPVAAPAPTPSASASSPTQPTTPPAAPAPAPAPSTPAAPKPTPSTPQPTSTPTPAPSPSSSPSSGGLLGGLLGVLGG